MAVYFICCTLTSLFLLHFNNLRFFFWCFLIFKRFSRLFTIFGYGWIHVRPHIYRVHWSLYNRAVCTLRFIVLRTVWHCIMEEFSVIQYVIQHTATVFHIRKKPQTKKLDILLYEIEGLRS